MKTVLTIFIGLLMLASCGGSQTSDTPVAVDTLPMLISQIRQQSRLYTAEAQLHKVVTFTDSSSVSGTFLNQEWKVDLPFGQRKIAIPLIATVKAYVDMSKISDSQVRRKGDKLEIVLPDPEIIMTATEIDHAQVKERVSWMRSNFSDEERTRIQQRGRQEIIKDLSRIDITERARQSAARQLIPLATQLGYSEDQITISFRKKFMPSDIPSLININR